MAKDGDADQVKTALDTFLNIRVDRVALDGLAGLNRIILRLDQAAARAEAAEAEVARLNHENAALEAEGRKLREALAAVQTAIGFALAEKNSLSYTEMRMLQPRIDAALAPEETPDD